MEFNVNVLLLGLPRWRLPALKFTCIGCKTIAIEHPMYLVRHIHRLAADWVGSLEGIHQHFPQTRYEHASIQMSSISIFLFFFTNFRQTSTSIQSQSNKRSERARRRKKVKIQFNANQFCFNFASNRDVWKKIFTLLGLNKSDECLPVSLLKGCYSLTDLSSTQLGAHRSPTFLHTIQNLIKDCHDGRMEVENFHFCEL